MFQKRLVLVFLFGLVYVIGSGPYNIRAIDVGKLLFRPPMMLPDHPKCPQYCVPDNYRYSTLMHGLCNLWCLKVNI
jgi:hypothetical protein